MVIAVMMVAVIVVYVMVAVAVTAQGDNICGSGRQRRPGSVALPIAPHQINKPSFGLITPPPLPVYHLINPPGGFINLRSGLFCGGVLKYMMGIALELTSPTIFTEGTIIHHCKRPVIRTLDRRSNKKPLYI